MLAICALVSAAPLLRAQTCTTQATMNPADRDTLAAAARSMALKVQSNDLAGLSNLSTEELKKNQSALGYLVGNTSPKLAGGTVTVEQVYLLDASNLKPNADGSSPDAQFFCALSKSTSEVQFAIPALPPGKYAFAMVTVAPQDGKSWRLSFLMRQESQDWRMAGFYPDALTAAGHDGLWYWTQARQAAKNHEQWVAWFYYQEAERLLTPVGFLTSTHLDKLRTEASAAAPTVLANGISAEAPLTVKAADGTEYHFTGLGVDDSLGQSSVDVAAHLKADAISDPAAARRRNDAAASALVAAYPELRSVFHGVWIYAEVAGQPPFATEQPMSDIK